MINIVNESKYTVNTYTYYDLGDSDSDSMTTDNPKNAVKMFIKMAAKNPMDTDIVAKTKEDACALVDWCVENEDEFRDMMSSTKGFPYKIDYMVDSCKEQSANRCRGFIGFDEFGDSVHPFSVG